MITIKVGRDFSTCPSGVFRSDGSWSAEVFREDVLIPALWKDHVEVDLSGTSGYGSSWLQGVFKTLYTSGRFTEGYIDMHLHIISSDSSASFFVDRAYQYIKDAKSENLCRESLRKELDLWMDKLSVARQTVGNSYKWFLENNYNDEIAKEAMQIHDSIGCLIAKILDNERIKKEKLREGR